MTDGPDMSAYEAEPRPAITPSRFRRALLHVVDDALPAQVLADAGRVLHRLRDRMGMVADEGASGWFYYQLGMLDQERDAAALCAEVRRAVLAAVPAALGPCMVPEHDARGVDLRARLLHQGGLLGWHDDCDDGAGGLALDRRLGFELMLRGTPPRFSGGELEFLDGTAVEPRSGRLVLYHPVQQKRVREVECWSADVLDGRWSLQGWVLGDPPAGWAERIAPLRAS